MLREEIEGLSSSGDKKKLRMMLVLDDIINNFC